MGMGMGDGRWEDGRWEDGRWEMGGWEMGDGRMGIGWGCGVGDAGRGELGGLGADMIG